MSNGKPAIFLDRDGTLIVETGYLCEPEKVELFPGAGEAVRRLAEADFELFIVTNQAGIGRGYLLHGRYSANTGQYGAARGMLRNASLLFRQAGSNSREADALLNLSHVQGHVGQLEEARQLANRALERASDDVQKSRCQLALALAALVGDCFEEALQLIDRAAARLRHLDDPTGGRGCLAAAALLRARTYRLAGRPRRAYGALQRAARLAARAGERRLQAETMARHGRL